MAPRFPVLALACAALLALAPAARAAEPPANDTPPTEVTLYSDSRVWWKGAAVACEGCVPQVLAPLAAADSSTVVVVDCHVSAFRVYVVEALYNRTIASVVLDCGDRGAFRVLHRHTALQNVTVVTDVEPTPGWPAVAVALGVVVGVLIAYQVGCAIFHCIARRNSARELARRPQQRASLSLGDAGAAQPLLQEAASPSGTPPMPSHASGYIPIPLSDQAAPASSALPPSSSSSPQNTVTAQQQQQPGAAAAAAQRPRARVGAVDVFRGLTLVLMVFVNYGGGGYYVFQHSVWDGLNFADLVFPLFIFVMGASVPLSTRSVVCGATRPMTPEQRRAALLRLAARSATLVALGLFLNNGRQLSQWRLLGVLQRFGLSYFAVVLLGTLVPKRPRRLSMTIQEDPFFSSRWSSLQDAMRDVFPYVYEYVAVAAVLAVHTAVTFLAQVPGCPRGYVGPGGISDGGAHEGCTGGVAGYIDRKIFGPHMYQHPTCQEMYRTGPFDPEGLLGYLTSFVLCFLGVQAGRTYTHFHNYRSRCLRWVLWGAVAGGAGVALALGNGRGGPVPINKNLWSASFVLVMAALGYAALALCYVTVDVWGVWSGSPFRYVGMNSIAVYVLHDICQGFFPFDFAAPDTHPWWLARNVCGCCACCAVAYALYLKKVFITV
eukprot:m51a1_g14497 hypothetical protein (662) ;mRNA; f:770269-772602